MYRIICLSISCLITMNANGQPVDYIFQSGFEGSSKLIQYNLNGKANPNYADIVGMDQGYDWVQDLDKDPNIGSFRIYYENGDTTKSVARIVPDPMDPDNHVLHYQIKAPHITYKKKGIILQKGRIQVGINGNPKWRNFSVQQRLFIHPDLALLKNTPLPITWLTLQEFWNNSPAKPFPFRVTVNIRKAAGINKELFFGAHAQIKANDQWVSIWETIDSTYPVPLGEWFTMKTEFIEGGAETGKFTVTLTDSDLRSHIIVDIQGYTHHPDDPNPDGVTNFNPMKLYTSSELIEGMNDADACLCLYWDDFEIRKGPLITAIDENNALKNIHIYPNPVTSILYIESENVPEYVNIYNGNGQLVRSDTFKGNRTLDVSHLNPGIYFVMVYRSGETYKTHRFVKQ